MEVVTKDLTFAYDSNDVLLDVSLRALEGRLTVILGPSGCGKTTLLRCISGLETKYKGSILFDGIEISKIRPEDRSISMIFQDFALYQTMSVRENIGIALISARVPKQEIKKRTEELTTMLGISALLDKKVTRLSGGERQRVAIARSFIRSPKLMLLDEPFANLDYELKKQIRSDFRKHQNTLKLTSIMVTHDQEEAVDLADQIIIMKTGEVLQSGSVEDIYYRPANLFVANFLGTAKINIFSTDQVESIFGKRETKFIGIRPEHVGLALKTNAAIGFKGKLSDVKVLPPHNRLTFQTSFGTLLMLTTERVELRMDEFYDLNVEPSNIIPITE